MVRVPAAAVLPGLLLALAAPGASAADGTPPEVTSWFADAPAVVAAQEDVASAEVGAPVALSTWSAAFLDGDVDAGRTAPLERWVAPVSDGGAVVGTITAERDADGVVGLAFVDDDIALADALSALPADATVVYDAESDTYVTVTGDTVTAIVARAGVETGRTTSVEQVRDDLAARSADDGADLAGLPLSDPRRAMAGGDGTSGRHDDGRAAPTTWAGAAGIALVAGGAVVLARRRHGTPAQTPSRSARTT